MLKKRLHKAIKELVPGKDIFLLAPKNPDHGDYAIHKSMVPDHKLLTSGYEHELIGNVQEVGDFINFSLSNTALWSEVDRILEEKDLFGKHTDLNGKKIIVEFAHPNTHKIFHIGHLRNITTGETLSRILESAGAQIIRANYQGDVGLHIAKCLYAVLKRKDEMANLKTLAEKIAFLGSTYTEGTRAYEDDESAKQEIQTINKQIFTQDPAIMPLWQETRAWSLEYFDQIYKRVHTKFDRLFFESEVMNRGVEIVNKALELHILEKSDGAIILKGDDHGVDTRVFISSLGLPMYEAKELGLGELEFSEFGIIDQCIHVVTPEQKSYFKTVFKVQELLDPKTYEGKQTHFAYEFVDLKEGKMSSRVGNIIAADWLLDTVVEKIKESYSLADDKAEVIGLAATKYAFLRMDAHKKIKFDIEESISLHGNSGPYLLYCYARAKSILAKESNQGSVSSSEANESAEEVTLLRTLAKFPEVVEAASVKMAPHVIATYLFDLAQKFNKLYESTPILKASVDDRTRLLQLISATAQVLKNGLYLLGIETLESI